MIKYILFKKMYINFYYEVDYEYPCKITRKKDRKNLRKRFRRIVFLGLMFAQDDRTYINEFKQMEFSLYNHLYGFKYVFNIGQKMYALKLFKANGEFHTGKFFVL